ncbi:hypothetical protein [Phenylobacterium sp.]|uniref:hypothetical protein n=1 Tax=Phenylobacterium sp. TaxID=1871053 RepID=UPI00356A5DC3
MTLGDAILIATANIEMINRILAAKVAAGAITRSEDGKASIALTSGDFADAGARFKTSVLDTKFASADPSTGRW